MASLTSLPQELIIHIIANSGLKSPGLYNLGLIVFPPFQAAFRKYNISVFPDGSMQNNPSLAPSDVDSSGWALELSDTKGSGAAFPRLDLVHMVEDCSVMPIGNTAWDKERYGKYEVLDSVRDAFEKAGVKLSITLKLSNPWTIGSAQL
ncbi:hypothetical protein VE03_00321 [Pseudogymnoascus sp. 23342-1-I1]|nr:hypothetical protein VE03_00321 [Pseudogymnoascus sp. 23342-1-I1]